MDSSSIYHVFNRGNNKQEIFFERENYLFFLKKVRIHVTPHVDMLAYCLMPNHFHFLIATNEKFDSKAFSNSFRILLSSYTRAINKQRGRTGSLFQQNTKFQKVDKLDQAHICFHYIHQNPMKAGLIDNMHDWEYSSFRDYTNSRNGTLCNQELAFALIDIPRYSEEFEKVSYKVISDSWFNND